MADSVRVIKKYSNRRLYDSRDSRYVTLEDLKNLILNGENFRVETAKGGEDVTRVTLLNVLLSEELFGEPVFSQQSLRNLVMFMHGPMRGPISVFFEQCIPSFIEAQTSFTKKFGADGDSKEMENLALLQGRLTRQLLEQYVFRGLENYLGAQQKMRQSMEQIMTMQMTQMPNFFKPPDDQS